jgi:hypothetical protein
MPTDSAFWRSLRADFESLQSHQFSVMWNSAAQHGLIGKIPGESHWSWRSFPDESLRARLSAIALRGARALGHDSEDAWYDELRKSEFVGFKLSGSSRERRSDGRKVAAGMTAAERRERQEHDSKATFVDSEFGPIHDVVKESITLCYMLEADAESPGERPHPTGPEVLDPEQRKAERGRRLTAAQERWHPIAKRTVPFAWIHKAAGVDHKDAYNWKSGKLADTSSMAKSIERILKQPKPPAAPVTE